MSQTQKPVPILFTLKHKPNDPSQKWRKWRINNKSGMNCAQLWKEYLHESEEVVVFPLQRCMEYYRRASSWS